MRAFSSNNPAAARREIRGVAASGGPAARWLGVILGSLLLAACAPPPPAAPLVRWPSRVVTEQGATFYVRNLRLAGTDQELKLTGGGGVFWVPLRQIQTLRFAGPVREGGRQARVLLTDGNLVEAWVRVEPLLQGETDLGYWSLPLSRVHYLEMGSD